jgi:hypothetical protein
LVAAPPRSTAWGITAHAQVMHGRILNLRGTIEAITLLTGQEVDAQLLSHDGSAIPLAELSGTLSTLDWPARDLPGDDRPSASASGPARSGCVRPGSSMRIPSASIPRT